MGGFGWHDVGVGEGRGFRRVLVEVDSKFVVDELSITVSVANDCQSLLLAIKVLINREWEVVFLSCVWGG